MRAPVDLLEAQQKGIEKQLKRHQTTIIKPHASAIVKGKEGQLEESAE